MHYNLTHFVVYLLIPTSNHNGLSRVKFYKALYIF